MKKVLNVKTIKQTKTLLKNVATFSKLLYDKIALEERFLCLLSNLII